VQEASGSRCSTHPFDNQNRLVRDGEIGHVEVTFSRRTGEVYTVRRWAKRSKFDVLDTNGDALGLDTKSAIKEWVAEKLGVDDADDLCRKCGSGVSGCRRRVSSRTSRKAKDRVDTFDPLFDIERYREGVQVAERPTGGHDEEITAARRSAELAGGDLPDVESEGLETGLRGAEADATIEHRVTNRREHDSEVPRR